MVVVCSTGSERVVAERRRDCLPVKVNIGKITQVNRVQLNLTPGQTSKEKMVKERRKDKQSLKRYLVSGSQCLICFYFQLLL